MDFRHLALVVILLALGGCRSRSLRDGEACLAMGDVARAAHFFSQRLDEDPTDGRARRGNGLALLGVARARHDDGKDDRQDWGNAVRELSMADTANDADVSRGLLEARLGWARSMTASGDTAKSMDLLEQLVVRDPAQTGPRTALAILLARTGQAERSEALFLQNAAIDSTNPDTWYNLGLLAWNSGHKVEAATSFLRAQKYAPKDPEILWWTTRATSEVEP